MMRLESPCTTHICLTIYSVVGPLSRNHDVVKHPWYRVQAIVRVTCGVFRVDNNWLMCLKHCKKPRRSSVHATCAVVARDPRKMFELPVGVHHQDGRPPRRHLRQNMRDPS
eukprot:4197379-Pyramimonas_sp.AAC.1